MATFFNIAVTECYEKCSTTVGCKAYSDYDPWGFDASCVLRSRLGKTWTREGYISGVIVSSKCPSTKDTALNGYDPSCPLDCVLQEFTDEDFSNENGWGPCESDGLKRKVPETIVDAVNGGSCPSMAERVPIEMKCPVNCVAKDLSEDRGAWGECSLSLPSYKTKVLSVKTGALNGGVCNDGDHVAAFECPHRCSSPVVGIAYDGKGLVLPGITNADGCCEQCRLSPTCLFNNLDIREWSMHELVLSLPRDFTRSRVGACQVGQVCVDDRRCIERLRQRLSDELCGENVV